MMDHFHIIIPCKAFGDGKSRLAGVLDATARRALCKCMLRQTLRLAAELAPASSIWLAGGADIGLVAGINVIPEQRPDLNAALDKARSAVLASHAAANLLILPIDLTEADAAAIEAALVHAADIVIAPDEQGSGTNLLYLRQAHAADFAFQYGADSFTRHCAQARRLGAAVAIVENPRLAFDLDEPGHYRRYAAQALVDLGAGRRHE